MINKSGCCDCKRLWRSYVFVDTRRVRLNIANFIHFITQCGTYSRQKSLFSKLFLPVNVIQTETNRKVSSLCWWPLRQSSTVDVNRNRIGVARLATLCFRVCGAPPVVTLHLLCEPSYTGQDRHTAFLTLHYKDQSTMIGRYIILHHCHIFHTSTYINDIFFLTLEKYRTQMIGPLWLCFS